MNSLANPNREIVSFRRGGIRGLLALDVRKFGPGRQGGIFGRVLGRFLGGFCRETIGTFTGSGQLFN